jgi:isopentenyl-diphosphate Delta-isomerase
MREKIAIVDKQDNEIGVIYRDQLKKEQIHRIVSIWIENNSNEVLLAQRSLHHKLHAGKWGPAAAGAVSYGETYEQAAYKELGEEIGIHDANLTMVNKVFYNIEGSDRFITFYKTILNLQPEQFVLEDAVAQVKWFKKAELSELLITKPDIFVPSHVLWPSLFLI